MPRLWSWFSSKRRCGAAGRLAGAGAAAAGAWYLLAAVAASPPAEAATVLEKTVVHAIQPEGEVVETVRLRVRLDEAGDLEAWSPYYVVLDDNRVLEDLEARAVGPGGHERRMGRRRRDRHQVSAPGVLHSSVQVEAVEFPPLPAGSVLEIEHRTRVRPYFPAGAIRLAEDEAVMALRVEVTGGGEGWRWHLDGGAEGLEVTEAAGAVTLQGKDLPAPEPPALAPRRAATGAVLRYAWGPADDWPAVGRWFGELARPVARGEEATRRLAARLAGPLESPFERLEALAGYVQEKVRYVAVEVGIGGFRPSPPGETLERKWGDCKDKSFLLLDLLRAAGVEAFPALILADPRDRLDTAFPAPNQFNHLIVAVPTAGLGEAVEDLPRGATEAGYLFVDPTQTRGRGRWLHPADQGQDVLVVRGDGGEVVPTPSVPEWEATRVRVSLTVDGGGAARGEVAVEVTGRTASGFLDALATESPTRVEAAVRSLFGRLLTGVRLRDVAWAPMEGDLPAVAFTAAVTMDGLVRGEAGRRSFRLPALTAAPAPGELDGRGEAVVLEPSTQEVEWALRLPAGFCPAEEQSEEVDNPVGSFRRSVRSADGTLRVTLRTELRRRWVGPELLADLEALSLAEHRGFKRRVRLRCPADPAP